MRGFTSMLLLALVAGASAANNNQQAKVKSPIKKVVEMLSDMLAKGKEEKQDETVRFAAYNQFCESTASEKAKNIGHAKAEIEQLEATIAKAQADVIEITNFVGGLDKDVATWTDDLARTTKERATAHAAFLEAHKEYVDSIDAVDRAMGMLQKGPGGKSVDQVAMLMQRESMESLIQTGDKKKIISLLQKMDPGQAMLQEAEEEGITIPQGTASAFEGSSGGIIDLVEKMGEKFRDEKRDLEKAEFNQKSAFQMMHKDLSGQIKTAAMERGMKETTKAKTLEAEAQAKGDLADTSASLAEDEKFLADLDSECKQKSWDYEQRQIVRTGEIEAIEKAIEIMSGDAVAGANAHTMFIQKATSLAQLRSKTRNPAQEAVATFLQQQADKTGSKLLMLIAAKAASDPFVKVRKMIKEMIVKLVEEANEEATHKGFCDTEMGTNKQTRDTKTSQSEELTADIEELTAEIAKLGSEITELGSELAALDSAVQQATNDRFEEKSKNQATIKDATAGEAAVAQALAVLKDFYEKAATPVEQPAPQQGPIAYDNRALQILKTATGGASFVQVSQIQRVPGAPEMEEGAYTGMGNGGVLGLMEVCQSDFAKVLSETAATEEEAGKIYEEFMADSSQDKAVKETDQKHKTAEKQTKESDKATAMKDLRITQEELHAAMEYYEKLKPDCEVKVVSYAEKKAAREAEIESLKEALELLVGN